MYDAVGSADTYAQAVELHSFEGDFSFSASLMCKCKQKQAEDMCIWMYSIRRHVNVKMGTGMLWPASDDVGASCAYVAGTTNQGPIG